MSSTARNAIQQLVQMGIQDFCICPGSRSTPLTLAIARHPTARSHIFHDERSAAFCALGMGLSGKLGALVVTSGTAVANAFPAVIEASYAHVPLLLLTADRPPELRSSTANQTIDQVKIFGEHVRFFFDVPCGKEYPPDSMSNILSFAVSKCFGNNPGPVHLNWMFREPFETDHTPSKVIKFPYVFSGICHLTNSVRNKLTEGVETSKNGIIVIGDISEVSEIEHLQKWVSTIQWPTIVDASSGLRLQNIDNMIMAWEDVLSNPPETFNPDFIIQIGKGLCSKRYEQWVTSLKCPIWVLNPYPIISNPSSALIYKCQVHIQTLGFLKNICINSNLTNWVRAHNKKVISALKQHVYTSFNEISIVQTLIQTSPNNTQVFLSNSMPIRDVNNYSDSSVYRKTASNRGASGIDGIISTAAGWLLSNQLPTLLIIGDLALMHDWGVLFTLSKKQLPAPLVILVINNGGGGIFSMLPISKQKDVFEEHFATAHTHRFSESSHSLGIKSVNPHSLEHLKEEVQIAWTIGGLTIIETNTLRSVNTAIRHSIRSIIQEDWL